MGLSKSRRSVPIGTMLGVYAFYVMLDADVAAEFS